MSAESDKSDKQAAAEESFLERWSRRKTEARQTDGAPEDGVAAEVPETPEAEPVPPEEPPGDEDMPPLEELGEDSDYSAFFSPRVSPGLRKKALAKFFHSPKFNIRDGLDDYDDDYTSFLPLGNTVTAEMRHRAENLLKRQLEQSDDEADGGQLAGEVAEQELAAGPAEDTDREMAAGADEDSEQDQDPSDDMQNKDRPANDA